LAIGVKSLLEELPRIKICAVSSKLTSETVVRMMMVFNKWVKQRGKNLIRFGITGIYSPNPSGRFGTPW
jgi:hypothetical protein